jgi:hypothetical protein
MKGRGKREISADAKKEKETILNMVVDTAD